VNSDKIQAGLRAAANKFENDLKNTKRSLVNFKCKRSARRLDCRRIWIKSRATCMPWRTSWQLRDRNEELAQTRRDFDKEEELKVANEELNQLKTNLQDKDDTIVAALTGLLKGTKSDG